MVGTLLRFYHNLDISLWHDEAFSALLIKYPWQEMFYRIGLDVHPPAYYVFLRFWHYIFGDSLLALRSFSVFFGVGSIWAVWLLVKTAFNSHKAGIVSAVFLAVNLFQIQYATEARMYTMGAFFTLLAGYFLVKALAYQTEEAKLHTLKMPNLPEVLALRKKTLWHYLGFTVSVIVMIYTHYYLLFASMAICFYGLVYLFAHHRFTLKNYILLLIAYFLILASYLPWLKTFLYQYKQVGAGYWIPPMTGWSIPSTLYTLLVGFSHDISQSSVQKLLVLTSLVVLFVLYKFLRQTQSFHKWLVLLVALAPFGGSMLFLILAKLKGSESSVYLVRYFIFTGAFLSIIVAVWLSQFKIRWVFWLLATGYCLLNLFAFINYWQDINIRQRPGMKSTAKYLQANFEPHHKLYSGSSFMFFNLKYYSNQFLKSDEPLVFGYGQLNIKPLLFSGGITDVSSLPHYAGTAILENKDLLPDFNQNVKTGDVVWLVWTNGFGAQKPSIPKNWTEITEQAFPEVRPYLGTSVFVSEYKVSE